MRNNSEVLIPFIYGKSVPDHRVLVAFEDAIVLSLPLLFPPKGYPEDPKKDSETATETNAPVVLEDAFGKAEMFVYVILV
jgi:hypothetical protein